MSEVTAVGLDIAKHFFHARGADATGRAVFGRRLTRGKLLDFFAAGPRAAWWRLRRAAARTTGRASCGRKYQGRVDPARLVFIDEAWANTNMAPLRGWALKGRRLHAKVPYGHWKTMTFLAALRSDRIDAPCV